MKRFLVTVISFVLSILAAKFWLKDWTAAYLLVGSITIHEVGHMLAIFSYGGRPYLVFIPFLGAATFYSVEEIQKLTWFQQAIVGLSGCFLNFLIMVASIIAYKFVDGGKYWLFLAALNSSFVVFNLLPLSIFDGNKFAQALFNSLNEEGDRTYVSMIKLLSYIASFVLALMGKLTLFPFGIIFGMINASRNDSPTEAYSGRAMSRSQAAFLTWVYCLMIFIAMGIDVYMPAILKIIK